MASLKAHEADRYLAKANLPKSLYFFYGPDAGLVRERGRKLSQKFEQEAGSANLVSLDMSEVEAEPDRLAREARSTSLFGGETIVRLRNASKKILPHIEDLFADWPDIAIIIEGPNLTPRDKLRSTIEKNANGMAIPCFADNAQDRLRVIDQFFSEQNISISPDAKSHLNNLLGNDREVTRRELEKLALYAAQTKQLNQEDIIRLSGDNSDSRVDEIVDAVGTGNLERLELLLQSAHTNNIDTQRILRSTHLHFTWLREKIAQAQSESKRPIDVMKNSWPKPHFSRHRALEQQARLWSDVALQRANQRLSDTTLVTRKQPQIAQAEVSRLLIALATYIAKR